MQRFTLLIGLAVAFGAVGTSAQDAGTWPDKPVHVVVPLTAGSATDVMARMVATRLSEQLGQPFIVENKPGAGGTIGMGAVARAKKYLEAGADAIFPEALVNADMFRAFAKAMPGVRLLANMTEFGRTPFFTAAEFEAMGYRMVIWPVSAFRIANKAQARLYTAIKRDGGTQNMVGEMQTRAELYETIGYHQYEALDASIVATVVPQGMPQR